MEDPLWTDRYAPNFESIKQENVRRIVQRTEGMNILLSGPRGCGKTAIARALAEQIHGTQDGMTEINVSDIFNRTKKEIRNDPRFERFLVGRSRMSKRDMINHIVKETTTYQPVGNTDYRTILLDNAESIREDFQQSLRRVIERHHQTTQFIIATREPSSLIKPIRSRFLHVPVRPPTNEELTSILENILSSEDAEYTEDGIRRAIAETGRDIRRCILLCQTALVEENEVTIESVGAVSEDIDDRPDAVNLLELADNKEYKDLKSAVEDILTDKSYTTSELIRLLNRTVESRYTDEDAMKLQTIAGGVDMDASEGQDGAIHITRMLAEWSQRS